jgi:acetoin utilization deacetylase AcuC-like enzyme
MEGGYAVDEIGINVCNVLAGFENGRGARVATTVSTAVSAAVST